MNKPYIDELTEKTDSKYTLIVAAAKRARQINVEHSELTRSGKINPVSLALKEINDGEVEFHYVEDEVAEDVAEDAEVEVEALEAE